jgi:hypothetical protein
MGRNTLSRWRGFTGGSKQGGISEIARKNSNTVIKVIIIIIIYYNGGNNKYEERDHSNSSSLDHNTQASQLNDWLFTLKTVVPFPVKEVFIFWLLHMYIPLLSPINCRNQFETNALSLG